MTSLRAIWTSLFHRYVEVYDTSVMVSYLKQACLRETNIFIARCYAHTRKQWVIGLVANGYRNGLKAVSENATGKKRLDRENRVRSTAGERRICFGVQEGTHQRLICKIMDRH